MYHRHRRLLPLLAALLLPATPARAIYKCHEAGVIRYTDVPCPGGKTLDFTAPPPDAAAARKRAAQDKAALKQLETERQAEDKKETQARRQQSRTNSAAQKKNKKCAALAQRRQWAEEDLRQADSTSVDKARRQSRRAAESYQRECDG